MYSQKEIRNARRFLTASNIDKGILKDKELVALAIINGWSLPTNAAPAPYAPTPGTPTPTSPPALDLIGQAINSAIDIALAKHDIKVDDQTIIDLIAKHATTTLKVQHYTKSVKKVTTTIEGAHKNLESIVKIVNAGLKPYLVGGAGVGKTTLAQQCAKALNLDFYMTGAVLQKFELLGFIDAGGKYHRTTFRDAYEKGGMFLFDENDASAEDALVAFNAAIDGTGFCVFPDATIEMHKDFKAISAANTVGTGATLAFTGRNAQDASVLNRFFMMEITVDEKLEARLTQEAWLAGGGAADSDTPKEWLALIVATRKAVLSRGLHTQVTPRDSIHGVTCLAAGLTRQEAIFGTFGSSLTPKQLKELGVAA